MNIYRRTRLILRKISARLAASRRGAAAVEFAILVPVIAAAVTGVANYGLVTFDKMELANAARAGAQLAIVNGDNSSAANQTAIKTAVVASASTGANITTANVSTTQACQCTDESTITCGDLCTTVDNELSQYYMTVTVTHDFDLLLLPGDLTVTTGWLNRALGVLGTAGAQAGVTLESATTVSLTGPQPTLAFGTLAGFGMTGSFVPQRSAAFVPMYAADAGPRLEPTSDP